MKNFIRWIRALFIWILDGWRVWSALGVVVIIIIVTPIFPGLPEDHARYAGLMLQLLGIATVVRGIRDRRHLFHRPSLYSQVETWFERRPRFSQHSKTIYATMTGAMAKCGVGKLTGWLDSPADASVEKQLEILRANLEQLRFEHSETYNELLVEIGKREDSVNLERRARETAIAEVCSQLDTLGAGGLHIEATGIFWLIVGVILGTAPSEVASLFRLS